MKIFRGYEIVFIQYWWERNWMLCEAPL